jgi:DNA-binding SARP family transcriptional activator
MGAVGVRFQLFGPMQFLVGDRAVDLGPSRQRAVLAALLADAGQPVTLDELADRVWDRIPGGARSALYAHISRLRALLATTGTGVTLTRSAGGYVLDAPRESVDLLRFRALVEQGQSDAGDERRLAAVLRGALRLWRGAPLAELPSRWAEALRESCEQQRLAAAALWARAELRLGQPAAVVAELSQLLTEHPLVESLVCELMRALYETGRGAEALDWYARTRKRLADEFGVEPGQELHELNVAILRGTVDSRPARASAAGWGPRGPVPGQLPSDPGDFVGRTEPLRLLDELLAGGRSGTVVVSGAAGVGKTALALHWAHAVRHRFPDGQLHADLRGHAARAPVRPVNTLARFLRALGVPPQEVPIALEESAGLFRSLLVGRQVLVVLDNAATAEQVRPLLPGTPGCLALVTSRNRLGGLAVLDGARRVELDVLDPAEATALLTQLLGRGRAADLDAVHGLAAACGYLPLALRIAAAALADRPHHPIADYLGSLTTGDRLALLAIADDGQTAVRTAFDHSYRALPAPAKRLFCLVGTFPGALFTVAATAALLDGTTAGAGQVLDVLAGAHMIQEQLPGRYALPELLSIYAQGLAETEITDREWRAAFRRLSDHYLVSVDRAARQLYPQLFRLPAPVAPHAAPARPATVLSVGVPPLVDPRRGAPTSRAATAPVTPACASGRAGRPPSRPA